MSRWIPCKRRDFVRRLRKLGFDGPFFGTKHQFMVYKQYRLALPSNAEYSVPQLRMMIREVNEITGHEVTADEWNHLYKIRLGLYGVEGKSKESWNNIPLSKMR